MSTFVTSKGTRGQHVSPKWQSRPYQPTPGRREFIYGRIQPLDQPRRSWLNRSAMPSCWRCSAWWLCFAR
jgi:hypothetical protein